MPSDERSTRRGRLPVASSLDGWGAAAGCRGRQRAGLSGLSARQRGVLAAAGVANALIFLDQTSVSVALPAIQREFHSSTSELQWTIGAYLLSLAALMAGSGRLANLCAGGLEAGMLVAAAAAVVAGVAALVLLPRRPRRRR
jgi:hypothetical protein